MAEELTDELPLEDPIALFERWHAAAREAETLQVEAMTLATVDASGRPSARTVLLKGVDARGFVFYTNHESRKGRELRENPRAALVFLWPAIERQVRVTGAVVELPAEESDAYFATRPRGSQLGAWASRQSAPIASRFELEARHVELAREYEGRDVPRPPHWGGFRVVPDEVEFWHGRADRLHDRFLFTRDGDGWARVRLQP